MLSGNNVLAVRTVMGNIKSLKVRNRQLQRAQIREAFYTGIFATQTFHFALDKVWGGVVINAMFVAMSAWTLWSKSKEARENDELIDGQSLYMAVEGPVPISLEMLQGKIDELQQEGN